MMPRPGFSQLLVLFIRVIRVIRVLFRYLYLIPLAAAMDASNR